MSDDDGPIITDPDRLLEPRSGDATSIEQIIRAFGVTATLAPVVAAAVNNLRQHGERVPGLDGGPPGDDVARLLADVLEPLGRMIRDCTPEHFCTPGGLDHAALSQIADQLQAALVATNIVRHRKQASYPPRPAIPPARDHSGPPE